MELVVLGAGGDRSRAPRPVEASVEVRSDEVLIGEAAGDLRARSRHTVPGDVEELEQRLVVARPGAALGQGDPDTGDQLQRLPPAHEVVAFASAFDAGRRVPLAREPVVVAEVRDGSPPACVFQQRVVGRHRSHRRLERHRRSRPGAETHGVGTGGHAELRPPIVGEEGTGAEHVVEHPERASLERLVSDLQVEDPSVEPLPLGVGQHAGAHHRHLRVDERDLAPVEVEQAAPGVGVDERIDVVLRSVGGRSEELDAGAPAENGEGGEGRPETGRCGADLGRELGIEIDEVPGQGRQTALRDDDVSVDRQRTLGEEPSPQRPQQERVAAGRTSERIEEPRRRAGRAQRDEQVVGVQLVERRHVDGPHLRLLSRPGEQARHAAARDGRPCHEEDQHLRRRPPSPPPPEVADEVGDEVDRRRIGPVEVVDGQDRHAAATEHREDLAGSEEEQQLRRGVVLRRRELPWGAAQDLEEAVRTRIVEVAGSRHQRADDREERDAALRLGGAEQDLAAGTLGHREEGADQLRLAEAGRPLDDHDPRVAPRGVVVPLPERS